MPAREAQTFAALALARGRCRASGASPRAARASRPGACRSTTPPTPCSRSEPCAPPRTATSRRSARIAVARARRAARRELEPLPAPAQAAVLARGPAGALGRPVSGGERGGAARGSARGAIVPRRRPLSRGAGGVGLRRRLRLRAVAVLLLPLAHPPHAQPLLADPARDPRRELGFHAPRRRPALAPLLARRGRGRGRGLPQHLLRRGPRAVPRPRGARAARHPALVARPPSARSRCSACSLRPCWPTTPTCCCSASTRARTPPGCVPTATSSATRSSRSSSCCRSATGRSSRGARPAAPTCGRRSCAASWARATWASPARSRSSRSRSRPCSPCCGARGALCRRRRSGSRGYWPTPWSEG